MLTNEIDCFWMTSLTNCVRLDIEILRIQSEIYVQYLKSMTLVMVKRCCNDEDLCWCSWVYKEILFPSDDWLL